MKKEKSEKMIAVVSLPGRTSDNSGCCGNIAPPLVTFSHKNSKSIFFKI
jgi:hypothetical protein